MRPRLSVGPAAFQLKKWIEIYFVVFIQPFKDFNKNHSLVFIPIRIYNEFMKYFVFSLLFSYGLKAWSIDPYACATTSDCVKVYSGCGRYGAAHRDHAKRISEKARKNDADSFCMMPSKEVVEAEKMAKPTCKDKKCQLIPSN